MSFASCGRMGGPQDRLGLAFVTCYIVLSVAVVISDLYHWDLYEESGNTVSF